MRENRLSNRVFMSYEDSVAWNDSPTVENHVHRDAGIGPSLSVSAGRYDQSLGNRSRQEFGATDTPHKGVSTFR